VVIDKTIKDTILNILNANTRGNHSQLTENDKEIESLLGLNFESSEALAKEVFANNNLADLYLDGINTLALNTSWVDIYQLLKKIEHADRVSTICDLGAANCRIALIAHMFFPKIRVISIEPVAQRMKRAQEVCADTHHLFLPNYFEKVADQIKFDYVFLYFPNGRVFERVLSKLKSLDFKYSILCIESHGEMINRLHFESSWLEAKPLLELNAPRHNPYLYLFEKVNKPSKSLESKFYQLRDHSGEFAVTDNHGEWLASSSNCEFYFDSLEAINIEFKAPPRTFKLELASMNKIRLIKNIDKELAADIQMRDHGKVRKVYLNGDIELASGELVKKGAKKLPPL